VAAGLDPERVPGGEDAARLLDLPQVEDHIGPPDDGVDWPTIVERSDLGMEW
jgi:hypothetical protein